MARHPGAEAVYECADLFRQRCLIDGRSLLWPDRAIWTAENLNAFKAAYIDRPDEGSGSFMEKWQGQLADQSDDILRIAADLMTIYCLMPKSSSMGAGAKRGLIQTIQDWRPESLPIASSESNLLDRAFAEGISKTGTYYNTGRHWELSFLLLFNRGIAIDGVDPNNLIACKTLADQLRTSMKKNTQSSITLIHLLFPDRIEAIASHEHRAKIAKTFAQLAPGIEDWDDRIYAIRNVLSNNGADAGFTFYRDDIRAQWQSSGPDSEPTSSVVRVNVENAADWQQCLKFGYLCVGWDKIGDLTHFPDHASFAGAFRNAYKVDYHGSRTNVETKAGELWTFFKLAPGDQVVATRGTDTVLGRGVVAEPGYQWLPSRSALKHTVRVDWSPDSARKVAPQQWRAKTVSTISATLLNGGSEGGDGDPQSPDPPASYVEPPFSAILEAVHAAGMRIEERTLRRYHLALKTRGFVVLSGLSGTGKTWLAERYASAIGARHLIVPVAPNWTTNEDLLGYASPLTERYHDTAFSRFLREAAAEYEAATAQNVQPRPYHVVLDEMNLARVEYYFAKFLSAMEVRMRDGRAEIELGPNDIVTLTPNLFVIGTVNIDETTHGFADKVYDRAQLLELEAHREDIVAHLGEAAYAEELLIVWDHVRASGPFTFRVLDEIARYIVHANDLGVPWQESLDEQLLQKVLPKLKGADLGVGKSLSDLMEWSQDRYPLTHARASLMLQRLHEHGFTSYH